MNTSVERHLDRLRTDWREAEVEQREAIEAEATAVRALVDAFPTTEVIKTFRRPNAATP